MVFITALWILLFIIYYLLFIFYYFLLLFIILLFYYLRTFFSYGRLRPKQTHGEERERETMIGKLVLIISSKGENVLYP